MGRNEIWRAIVDALTALGTFEVLEDQTGALLKKIPDDPGARFFVPKPQNVSITRQIGGSSDARDKRAAHDDGPNHY